MEALDRQIVTYCNDTILFDPFTGELNFEISYLPKESTLNVTIWASYVLLIAYTLMLVWALYNIVAFLYK